MNTKKIIQSVAAIAILALVFVKIPVQPVLAQEFGDTTATEFAVNTSNTCYIGEADDGELLLVPTVGEEFSGPGLPVGWSSIPWTSGGGATVSGGQLSVDGALFATDSYYGPGRTLEFVATFGADTYQHIGFGQDFEVAGTETWAIFGTLNSTTSLYARTNNLGDMNDFQIPIPLSGSWIGSAHNYRINWGVSSIEFYIDGSLVHSQPVTISTDMRPAISDYNLPAPSIDVDWIRMSPYSSSCVFDSRSINAGASTTWADLDWTGSVPLNTTADFYTRVSDDINGPWSDWALVDGAGNLTGIVDGQYIQYRIELASTDDSVTPIIEDVTLTSADKVWNGSASSDWGTAANWTPSGVPSTLDDVLIPAPGPGNWPQISGAAESDGLIVQDGAELAIQSSGSLNAAGKVKNHGVLIQTIATLPANTPTSFLNIGATKPYYGVDMSPAAVMNNVTVSIAGNKECTTFSGESVRRCFDIQAPDGILTTVTFHYLPNELNGLNPETMLAYHWTAPGWEDAGVFQSRVASGSNLSVTMSGVNNFSPFVLAPGTPTAVNLESFAEASTNAANTVWNSVILFAFLLVILIGMTMIIIRKRNLQH